MSQEVDELKQEIRGLRNNLTATASAMKVFEEALARTNREIEFLKDDRKAAAAPPSSDESQPFTHQLELTYRSPTGTIERWVGGDKDTAAWIRSGTGAALVGTRPRGTAVTPKTFEENFDMVIPADRVLLVRRIPIPVQFPGRAIEVAP